MTDSKKFEMISHRVGIDPINQSIVQVENKAQIAEKFQSARTMVKYDQCMICNSMSTNRMWSCLYQPSPSSIWSIVVHCDKPICFASSLFVIKNELANAKRFLWRKIHYRNCFQTLKFWSNALMAQQLTQRSPIIMLQSLAKAVFVLAFGCLLLEPTAKRSKKYLLSTRSFRETKVLFAHVKIYAKSRSKFSMK